MNHSDLYTRLPLLGETIATQGRGSNRSGACVYGWDSILACIRVLGLYGRRDACEGRAPSVRLF